MHTTSLQRSSDRKGRTLYQRIASIAILFSCAFLIQSLSAEDAEARVTYAYGRAANGCRFKMTTVYDANDNITGQFTEYYLCPVIPPAPSQAEVNAYALDFLDENGEEVDLDPQEEADMRYELYLDLVELSGGEIE